MTKPNLRSWATKRAILYSALLCATRVWAQDASGIWVSTTINSQSGTPLLVEVQHNSDDIVIDKNVWENELKLRWMWGDQSKVSLNDLKKEGVSWSFDQTSVALKMDVPAPFLTTTTDINANNNVLSQPNAHGRGVVWSYDLFARHDRSGLSGGVWNDGRIFFDNNTFVQANATTFFNERSTSTVRLDTTWQWNNPNTMINVKVGDSITSGPDWTRAVRFGGIWVGRDFSLQPYRTTIPLASYVGEAALPSKVDVFVDGVLQSQKEIQPGQFQINNIVPSTGAGLAVAQVTDITGRIQTISIPLYGSGVLLQKGLWDGGVGVGYVRRQYGIQSSNYDKDPMASLSLRYGLSDYFTSDVHAEGSSRGHMWGVGGNLRLGTQGGLLRASHSQSDAYAQKGERTTWEYQWSNARWALTLGQQDTSQYFWDVAAEEAPRLSEQHRQRYGFASINNDGRTFGAAVVQNTTPTIQTNVSSVFFSQQFKRGSSLYVSASHTSGTQKDNRITAYWYKPLDNNRSVSSSIERTKAGNNIGLDMVQSQPTLGWGTRAQLRSGDTDRAAMQVGYSNTAFAWDAGVDYYRSTQSNTAVYTGMRGSVVWMNGLHPSRQIIDSFAVVDTNTPNIPVYLENNLVGETNSHGVLLVPYLQAYQRNKISVDGSHLPVEYKIPTTSQWIVPRQNQGVNVVFDVKAVSSITATVVDKNNTPLPLGAVLRRDGESTMVGYDGMVYIEQPTGIWRDSQSQCQVEIPAVLGYTTLGVLVCK